MQTYYNADTHEYFVDDIKRPSVTEICEPISFKRLDAISKMLLEKARARGERCHELAEQYLLAEELDPNEIESDYIPYINQFMLWVRTYRPKVWFTEKKLFDYDFCGTTDLICEVDGKLIIVDYKFTANADKKSLSVQLEGYYRLCHKLGIPIEETWYLHIKKDGFVFKQIKRDSEWFDLLLRHNQKMKEKYKE